MDCINVEEFIFFAKEQCDYPSDRGFEDIFGGILAYYGGVVPLTIKLNHYYNKIIRIICNYLFPAVTNFCIENDRKQT
jgi:hypothetical protein